MLLTLKGYMSDFVAIPLVSMCGPQRNIPKMNICRFGTNTNDPFIHPLAIPSYPFTCEPEPVPTDTGQEVCSH